MPGFARRFSQNITRAELWKAYLTRYPLPVAGLDARLFGSDHPHTGIDHFVSSCGIQAGNQSARSANYTQLIEDWTVFRAESLQDYEQHPLNDCEDFCFSVLLNADVTKGISHQAISIKPSATHHPLIPATAATADALVQAMQNQLEAIGKLSPIFAQKYSLDIAGQMHIRFGWEEEFVSTLCDNNEYGISAKQLDPRVMVAMVSAQKACYPFINEIRTDGMNKDEPIRITYEASSVPLDFLGSLHARNLFWNNMLAVYSAIPENLFLADQRHQQPFQRFGNHIHWSMTDDNGKNLFATMPETLRRQLAAGVLATVDECIILLATPLQLIGVEKTVIKHLKVSIDQSEGEHSGKTSVIRETQKNQEDLHYELRRVMPSANSAIDPYLSACLVIAMGVRHAMENALNDVYLPIALNKDITDNQIALANDGLWQAYIDDDLRATIIDIAMHEADAAIMRHKIESQKQDNGHFEFTPG